MREPTPGFVDAALLKIRVGAPDLCWVAYAPRTRWSTGVSRGACGSEVDSLAIDALTRSNRIRRCWRRTRGVILLVTAFPSSHQEWLLKPYYTVFGVKS